MSDVITIRRASPKDIEQLAKLAALTFVQSHGHSASQEEINNYVAENYSTESMQKELSDPPNIYFVAELNGSLAGFSKIILNKSTDSSPKNNLTYLGRFYLLPEHHGTGLAMKLWDCNLNIVHDKKQNGIWLNVWIENLRAISFYKKLGFKIIGKCDYEISPTHFNPNHIMLFDI